MTEPPDLIQFWQQTEDPDFHAVENSTNPPPRPFTILNGAQLRGIQLPPKVNVLGDGVIALGQLTTVIGQGGTGKSRVVMQMCFAQVLGLPFAGMATHPKPLRHLLIGTENSIYRQQSDYLKMTGTLTPEQQALVDAHIFFHVVQEIDDAFINLGQTDIRNKWLDTLDMIKPDCIYIDPYGEVHIGDINKDADVRHTLREITKVCRKHSQDTAIIIVHHARTGRQNIAQAVGWDKGNFALGSKALYSGCRSQVNIAPADPEDPSRIVISCGKSNDAKPFEPVGLKLDENTMLYDIDPCFDLQAWKDDVEGKNSGQSASIQDVIIAINAGETSYSDLCKAICDNSGCSKSTAKRRVQDAMEKNYVRKDSKGRYLLTKKGATICPQETSTQTGFTLNPCEPS